MRKIRIIELISLDAVIQASGGPNQNWYRYGRWASPHADPAGGEAMVAAHGEPRMDAETSNPPFGN